MTCVLAAHVSAECPAISVGETTYVFELPQVIENDIGRVRIIFKKINSLVSFRNKFRNCIKVIDEAKCVYAFTEMWSDMSFEEQKDFCKENIPKGGCDNCVGEMLTYHTEVIVKK